MITDDLTARPSNKIELTTVSNDNNESSKDPKNKQLNENDIKSQDRLFVDGAGRAGLVPDNMRIYEGGKRIIDDQGRVYKNVKGVGLVKIPESQYSESVDLGTGDQEAARTLERIKFLIHENADSLRMNEVLKPGSSIDEGIFDAFEQFGFNVYQTDDAYAGTYKGYPVKMTTFGNVKLNDLVYKKPLKDDLKFSKSDFKYIIRFRNVDSYDLLNIKFKNPMIRDLVHSELLNYY